MFNYKSFLLFFVLMPILNLAQEQSNTLSCNQTTSMTFEPTKFAGLWYEIGRNPAPVTAVVCAQVNLTLQNDNVMLIATTFGDAPAFAWVNATETANISLGDANNPYGYNFSYYMPYHSFPVITYKLLDTDYDSYALICGYSNISDVNSFFNIVMTRDRMPSGEFLNQIEANASLKYDGFSNSSLTVITQDVLCYTFGAAPNLVPLNNVIFMLVVALLFNLVNVF